MPDEIDKKIKYWMLDNNIEDKRVAVIKILSIHLGDEKDEKQSIN